MNRLGYQSRTLAVFLVYVCSHTPSFRYRIYQMPAIDASIEYCIGNHAHSIDKALQSESERCLDGQRFSKYNRMT